MCTAMRLFTSKLRASLTGVFLIVALDLAQGQGLPNNPYSFEVPNGVMFHVSVAFDEESGPSPDHKPNEVAMSFWREDRKHGENYSEWPGTGNYDKAHRRDYQGNNGGVPTRFAFNVGYKDTPPDFNQKWHFSPGAIDSETTREEPRSTVTTTVISYHGAKITVEIIKQKE